MPIYEAGELHSPKRLAKPDVFRLAALTDLLIQHNKEVEVEIANPFPGPLHVLQTWSNDNS